MGSIPVRVMNKIPDLRIRDFFMQPVRGIEGTRPPAGGKKEPSGLFFSVRVPSCRNVQCGSCFMQPVRESNSTALRSRVSNQPSGLLLSAPGCGSQHPRVPWAARASCWPLPQQLLPASATGRGRRCCKSHPVGMSNVVAAAAMRKGVFNLTRTGIAAELTAASDGNREAKLEPWSAGCERRSKA